MLHCNENTTQTFKKSRIFNLDAQTTVASQVSYVHMRFITNYHKSMQTKKCLMKDTFMSVKGASTLSSEFNNVKQTCDISVPIFL